MAQQNNEVKVKVTTEADAAQIRAYTQAFQELMTLIKGAGGGIGFLGPGMTGGGAREHLSEGLAGYPVLGGSARVSMMGGLVEMTRQHAIQMGIQVPDMPSVGTGYMGVNPPAFAPSGGDSGMPINPMAGSGILPYGYSGATYRSQPPMYGSESAERPYVMPGQWAGSTGIMPWGMGSSITPWGRGGGGAIVASPNWRPGQPALPPPGGGSWDPMGGWDGSTAITPYRGGGAGGGGVSGRSIGDAGPGGGLPGGIMPGDITEGAKKAGGNFRMMHALLFQAFFGILFGGLQEYAQSGATGKAPPGGMLTMAPAILDLVGMGAGFLAGGPMGAMAGGMVGQLGGIPIAAGAKGRGIANEAIGSYARAFGSGPGIAGGTATSANWLDAFMWNSSGATQKWNMEAELHGMTGLGPGRSEGIQASFRAVPGEDSETTADRIHKARKFSESPWLEAYYAPDMFGPDIRRKRKHRGYTATGGFGGGSYGDTSGEDEYDIVPGRRITTDAGVVAHYLEGGEDAVNVYDTISDADKKRLYGGIREGRNAYTVSNTMTAPWIGVGQSAMEMGQSLGSSRLADKGYSFLMKNLTQELRDEKRLQASLVGTPGAEKALNDISAKIGQLNMNMAGAFQSSWESPTPPEDKFKISSLQTVFKAQQTLGMGWTRYAKELGYGGFGSLDMSYAENPRKTLRGMVGEYSGELERLQADYWKKLAEGNTRYGNYNEVDKANSAWPAQRHALGAAFQEQARPYREAIIGALGQLETGWQDRLVEQQWNMSSRSVDRQFSLIRAGRAYEDRFGEPNHRFGGRMGLPQGNREYTPGRSDASTGRGGVLAQVIVNQTITVTGGASSPGLEKRLSQFKQDVANAASSLGGEVDA